MSPKIRTNTEDVNIRCQPSASADPNHGNSQHPTALPSPILRKKFQAGQQLRASICLSLYTYNSTKLYRNNFIQHSCLQSRRSHSFTCPQCQGVTAGVLVLDQLLHLLLNLLHSEI